MTSLIFLHLSFGLLALLVVLFVAFPYRGRTVPKAERITGALAAVTERVDPGESPPLGVLTTPEKARRISRRFEMAEWKVRRGARALTTVARSGG
ncbi:MAG: hypothetical protein ACXV2I_12200 [Actinomycetes bacterium]